MKNMLRHGREKDNVPIIYLSSESGRETPSATAGEQFTEFSGKQLLPQRGNINFTGQSGNVASFSCRKERTGDTFCS